MKGLTVLSLIAIGVMFASISFAKIDMENARGIWLFDEGSGKTAKDLSGNDNDGTPNGAKWVAGKFKDALEFDDGDFVECGKGESLNLGDSDLTIGAWIKQKNFDGYQMILTKGKPGVGANKGYRLRIEQGGAPLFTVTGDQETDLNSRKPLPKFDEWFHIVGVKDAKNMTIYVDGKEWAQAATPPGSTDNEVPLQIGRYPDGQWYFHGIIDEVFIFDVALSVTDIETIMDKGLSTVSAVSPGDKLSTTWGQIKNAR